MSRPLQSCIWTSPDLTQDQTGLSPSERVVRVCLRNGKPHLRLQHSSHDSFPVWVSNTCRRFDTITFFIVVCFSFHLPDYKSVPASYARATDGPRRLHQLHPVPLTHTWHHRLLHIQGLIFGLYGEPNPRPCGLPWGGMYHRATLPHQHWDVSGHESEVRHQNCLWRTFLILYIYVYNWKTIYN